MDNPCAEMTTRPSLLPGEYLALTARGIVFRNMSNLTIVSGPVPESFLDKAAMAADFHRRGPAFAVRAIYEEWDWQRLILELYI